MQIYPLDELPPIIGGDALVYSFFETTVYPALIPYHVDAQGNTYNDFVGEIIQTTAVARIEGNSFYVKWAIGTLSAEATLERGYLLHNEITARRLFPRLAQYAFKGDFHGTDHPG